MRTSPVLVFRTIVTKENVRCAACNTMIDEQNWAEKLIVTVNGKTEEHIVHDDRCCVDRMKMKFGVALKNTFYASQSFVRGSL